MCTLLYIINWLFLFKNCHLMYTRRDSISQPWSPDCISVTRHQKRNKQTKAAVSQSSTCKPTWYVHVSCLLRPFFKVIESNIGPVLKWFHYRTFGSQSFVVDHRSWRYPNLHIFSHLQFSSSKSETVSKLCIYTRKATSGIRTRNPEFTVQMRWPSFLHQGCQIFSWCMIPKVEKMYQMNTKCTKWS
jgi:hypothetical protein